MVKGGSEVKKLFIYLDFCCLEFDVWWIEKFELEYFCCFLFLVFMEFLEYEKFFLGGGIMIDFMSKVNS